MPRFSSLLRDNKDIVLFLFLMIIFRSSFADINRVPTGSMKPTIVEGDRIVVNKLAYDVQFPLTNTKLLTLGNPDRGDIVVFNSKVSEQRLVKRVIGLPGDTVSMTNNQLRINGKPLSYWSERDTQPKTDELGPHHDLKENLFESVHSIRVSNSGSRLSTFAPVSIPAEFYLTLGDNRDNSADSRVIGLVPRSEIIGRSRRVLMSLNPNNYYLPRLERFLKTL